MDKNAKIYIAGHRGLVGSAIWKNLQEKGYTNLVGCLLYTSQKDVMKTLLKASQKNN